jgi:hypothetical protein
MQGFLPLRVFEFRHQVEIRFQVGGFLPALLRLCQEHFQAVRQPRRYSSGHCGHCFVRHSCSSADLIFWESKKAASPDDHHFRR